MGPQGRRGEWRVEWHDGDGGRHREKAGTKSLALDLYRRRKSEVRQLVKFPESMRQRDARLKDLVADYLEAVGASQAKTADVIARRLAVVVGILGNVEAKTVKAEDLERLKLKLATGTRTATRKAASINRYLQDLKAVFCKAVDSGKLDRHPFNGVDLLTENNKRARELSPEEDFDCSSPFPAIPRPSGLSSGSCWRPGPGRARPAPSHGGRSCGPTVWQSYPRPRQARSSTSR